MDLEEEEEDDDDKAHPTFILLNFFSLKFGLLQSPQLFTRARYSMVLSLYVCLLKKIQRTMMLLRSYLSFFIFSPSFIGVSGHIAGGTCTVCMEQKRINRDALAI